MWIIPPPLYLILISSYKWVEVSFFHLSRDKNHFLWVKFVSLWKYYIWCICCSEALQILLWKLIDKNSFLRETKINSCFLCTSQILPKMNEGIRTIRRKKLQLACKFLGNQAIIVKEMQKKIHDSLMENYKNIVFCKVYWNVYVTFYWDCPDMKYF